MPELPVPPALTITIPRFAPITNMALQYNGTTDFLFVPGILLGQQLSQISIEAWVFLDSARDIAPPPNQLVWKNTDADTTAFFVNFQNTTLQFGYNSTYVQSFNFPFTLHEWYYIVITYDATAKQIVLYVNGQSAATASITSAAPVKIGPANVGSTFLGNIGTIRVWKGILSQAYIQRFMFMTLTGAVELKNETDQIIATLVGNWRCDEGYGDLAFDYLSTFNAVLGGGNPANSPDWTVSTALKPPDFIGLLGNPVVTNNFASLMIFDNPSVFIPPQEIEPVKSGDGTEGVVLLRPLVLKQRTAPVKSEAVVEEVKKRKSMPRKAKPTSKTTKGARRKGVKR